METKQEQPKNIYQRCLGVMSDLDYIQKDKKKVNNLYSAVTHDAVSSKIHPLLVKHGIFCVPTIKSLKQDTERTEICLCTRYVNVDDPRDYFEVEMWGYGLDKQDKGVGKAVSYATKYTHLKVFVLETGDDPDLDQTTEHKPATQGPKAEASEEKLSFNEAMEIENLINGDEEFKKRVLIGYQVASLQDIPRAKFNPLIKNLKSRTDIGKSL